MKFSPIAVVAAIASASSVGAFSPSAFTSSGTSFATTTKAASASRLNMVLEKPRPQTANGVKKISKLEVVTKPKKISKLEQLKVDSDNLVHPLKEVSLMKAKFSKLFGFCSLCITLHELFREVCNERIIICILTQYLPFLNYSLEYSHNRNSKRKRSGFRKMRIKS